MKKIAKSVVAILFCLCLFTATATTGLAALGTVKNFKATATPTAITLTWSKVSGATGYEIQQYSNKKWQNYKTITKASTTSLKITGLTPNKTYKYRIRAYQKKLFSNTYSAYTKELSAKTTVAKVTGLKATPALTSTKLTWTKVSGATGYEVYQYNSSSKKWVKKKTLSGNSLTISSLSAGKTYKFRVRAYTKVSKKSYYGSYSSSLSVKTAVPKVTGFKLKSSTYNTATLSWSKVSNATAYQLQKYDAKTKKWSYVSKKISSKNTTYALKSLNTGSEYKYRIRAYQTVKKKTYYGAWSSTLSVKTALKNASGLKHSSLSASSVKLNWTAVSGATGYQICRNVSGKWTVLSTVKTNSATVKISAATNYQIAVRAYRTVSGKNVYGGYSNTVTFTSNPGQVTGLKNTAKTDSSITVSWNKLTGAQGYEVSYYADGKWTSYTTTATSYTVSNLKNGTSYGFKVRAYLKYNNATLYGAYSAQSNFVTTGLLPVTPAAGSITLKWQAVSGAAKYTVQRYNTSTYTWDNIATGLTATSYKDTSVKAGLYRVIGYNAGGSAVYTSTPLTATAKGITVTQDKYKVTISWVAQAGATSYKVSYTNGKGSPAEVKSLNSSTRSVTLYLAPALTYEFTLSTNSADFAQFGVAMPAINTSDKSNASVNGQLLYLVNAINKTKFDNDHIVAVKETRYVDYEMSYLSFGLDGMGDSLNIFLATYLIGENILPAGWLNPLSKDYQKPKNGVNVVNSAIVCEGTTAVEALYNKLSGEGESFKAKDIGENVEATYEFKNGKSSSHKEFDLLTGKEKTSYKTAYLTTLLEPIATTDTKAFLYNGQNPDAWKNGFSSVATTKLSNGGYKISATLKAEKTPSYHNGFISSLGSLEVDGFEGMDMKTVSVGATTITAETDAQGRLTSYSIKSPYANSIITSESLAGEDEDGNAETFALSMRMDMKGNMNYTYAFARTAN